jgi:hypothetical protein
LHGIVERHNGQNDTEKFVYFLAEEESDEAQRGAFARSLRLPCSAVGRRDLLLFKIRAHRVPQASG